MHTAELTVQTKGRSLVDVTKEVERVVRESRIENGLANVFIRHTSASLIVGENADPDVLRDLERFLGDLVEDGDPRFVHTAEGPDDMPSHVKAMLNGVPLHIPVLNGALALGTWQSLYLAEHRARPHRREVVLQFIGNRR